MTRRDSRRGKNVGRPSLAALGLTAILASASLAGEPPAASELFRQSALPYVTLSPSGRFLAGEHFENDKTRIQITEHVSGRRVWLDLYGQSIDILAWADDDTLIVSSPNPGGRRITRALDLVIRDGDLECDERQFRGRGRVVDSLPDQADTILYASDGGNPSVYRIQTSEIPLYAPSAAARREWDPFKVGSVVASLKVGAGTWISDRHGAVRAALSMDKGSDHMKIWYRDSADAAWRVVAKVDVEERSVAPVGFAADDRNLLVVSNQGRDTRALFEFDVATGQLGSLVFEHPSGDVVGALIDQTTGGLLAVAYQDAGLRKYHYLGRVPDEFQRELETAYPDRSIAVAGLSRDGRYAVVLVSGARDPGSYYLVDRTSGEALPAGSMAPWLDPADLVDVRALSVRSPSGARLDAFLALPPHAAAAPPLVVMPHGGPLGVRDDRTFNPEVQYLATRGFAVLQVNYRGSGGYGKSFLEAGYREWGEGIEDDVDAAIEHVLGLGVVDPTRICIVGASYGGYSALMSVIRHPDRFRCAVTLSGVSDVALMFSTGDIPITKESRDWLREILGDPELEYARMVERSPVYRVAEIRPPLLIAHGSADLRVDVEHAFRLRAMLDLHDKPYEWLILQGARHSLTIEQAAQYYDALWRFLYAHLFKGN